MYEDLKIIHYPDPRLKRISAPVKEFNGDLGALAQKMFELMRAARGVGLAAPQVGLNIRLFVANHTGNPEDDRVYVNPTLFEAEGEDTAEEGCLSIPTLSVEVVRAKSARMNARDVAGAAIDQHETGYVARIWQHELDHLNGVLLTDRMGPTAEMENRKLLKDLEDKYAEENPPGKKKGKQTKD
jgi:peptide deformylase